MGTNATMSKIKIKGGFVAVAYAISVSIQYTTTTLAMQ